MRAEIKKLHQKLQTTFIYVTHDQTEALTMGDRIAVIDKGIIQQIGTPLEVYNNPVNKFVGGFLGSPSMNFILCDVVDNSIALNGIKIQLNKNQQKVINNKKQVFVGIRPEKFNTENCNVELKATVEISEMLGNSQIVYFKINDCECSAAVTSDFVVLKEIELKINSNNLMFFDIDTNQRLN